MCNTNIDLNKEVQPAEWFQRIGLGWAFIFSIDLSYLNKCIKPWRRTHYIQLWMILYILLIEIQKWVISLLALIHQLILFMNIIQWCANLLYVNRDEHQFLNRKNKLSKLNSPWKSSNLLLEPLKYKFNLSLLEAQEFCKKDGLFYPKKSDHIPDSLARYVRLIE